MYGLGETASEAHTRLIRELHDVAVAINVAKQAGDVERVQYLRGRFDVIASEYRGLDSGDKLTGFDSFLLATDKWIRDSLNALPGAISAIPAKTFEGVLRGVLPWALGYAGLLYLMRKV